jgi:APA family basic amino acid/polyamine antiporter
MVVAIAALGGADYRQFANSTEPLALILRMLEHPAAATFVAAAVIIALPTVIMAFMYGQSRVFFVMARDGLLPQRLATVHPRFGTPVTMTLITGIIVALIAAFLPLQKIVELANAGTLAAFIAVSICMMKLRVAAPDHPRLFRTPWPWAIGIAGIVGCLLLFLSLPYFTMASFFVWNAAGLIVYFLYARHRSLLNAEPVRT